MKTIPANFAAHQFKKSAPPISKAPAKAVGKASSKPMHYGGNMSSGDACDTFGNHRAK